MTQVMTMMQGDQGVATDISLPPASLLMQYDRLALDFRLGCPGKVQQSNTPANIRHCSLGWLCMHK